MYLFITKWESVLSMLFLLVKQTNVKVKNGCTVRPQTMGTKAWQTEFLGDKYQQASGKVCEHL